MRPRRPAVNVSLDAPTRAPSTCTGSDRTRRKSARERTFEKRSASPLPGSRVGAPGHAGPPPSGGRGSADTSFKVPDRQPQVGSLITSGRQGAKEGLERLFIHIMYLTLCLSCLIFCCILNSGYSVLYFYSIYSMIHLSYSIFSIHFFSILFLLYKYVFYLYSRYSMLHISYLIFSLHFSSILSLLYRLSSI